MTDERIIAYLLEELPGEELEKFEEECFALETWPAQLVLAEEDLIDAYLRDELTRERRRLFEKNYLITEARRERLAVAAALLRHVDRRQGEADAPAVVAPTAAVATSTIETATIAPSAVEPAAAVAAPSRLGLGRRLLAAWRSQTWALRAAAATVMVAVVAVGAWWLYRSGTSSPRTFVPLTLTSSAGERKSGGPPPERVAYPLGADALRVSLALPERLSQDAVTSVRLDSDSADTETLEIEGRDDKFITVVIPAGRLARGQYVLKLVARRAGGAEQTVPGGYYFSVE